MLLIRVLPLESCKSGCEKSVPESMMPISTPSPLYARGKGAVHNLAILMRLRESMVSLSICFRAAGSSA